MIYQVVSHNTNTNSWERYGGIAYSEKDAEKMAQAAFAFHGGTRNIYCIAARTQTELSEKWAQLCTGADIRSVGTAPQMSPQDRRRFEMDSGPGGDHDTPYVYTTPTEVPVWSHWVKLWRQVRTGLVGGENDGAEEQADEL